MKSIEYIETRLAELYSNFHGIKIRYDYRANSQSHIIEVLPLDFYEQSLDYLTFEAEMEQEFETTFPEETIIFISQDSLSQIINPCLSWGYDLIDIYLEKFSIELNPEELKPTFEDSITYVSTDLIQNLQSINDYAIAA